MQKTKTYWNTRFPAAVLREAIDAFRGMVNNGKAGPSIRMTVEVEDADWMHDSFDEFIADYRKSSGGAVYQEENGITSQLRLQAGKEHWVQVTVGAPKRGD